MSLGDGHFHDGMRHESPAATLGHSATDKVSCDIVSWISVGHLCHNSWLRIVQSAVAQGTSYSTIGCAGRYELQCSRREPSNSDPRNALVIRRQDATTTTSVGIRSSSGSYFVSSAHFGPNGRGQGSLGDRYSSAQFAAQWSFHIGKLRGVFTFTH